MDLITNQNSENLEKIQALCSCGEERYQKFAFGIFCELLNTQLFSDAQIPLSLFWNGIYSFSRNYKKPIEAINTWIKELEVNGLSTFQKYFICHWLCKCMANNRFTDSHLEHVRLLMEAFRKKLKKEVSNENNENITDFRDTLKQIVARNAEDVLDASDFYDRDDKLKILTKLTPIILQKETAFYAKAPADFD